MPQMQPVNNSILDQVKNAYRNNPVQTLAIGMGVAILAPAVLPLVKPFAKAAIKSGVSLYEKTRGAIADTGEAIGDIVAEAKAEVAAEQAKKISVAAGLIAEPNKNQEAQEN
ncbi:MAG: DUF5132 domain-containing protein [Xenococcaceae cyanobacterium MO_207.B15]|nr:DUF5132 domain-containing protein [Xenococcaceae cyanobacterium MO_207.B15]MDJ0742135.1 DUF5132 domain-containing protein [Xenococcaceae cyanobacterium MO_167.B27]